MLTLTLAMALAQPPAQPAAGTPAQPQGTVTTTEQTFRVKNVLNAQVMVANNTRVGVIEDLVFDQDGTIEYALVADQGKLVTVPWAAIKWGNTAASTTTTNQGVQQTSATAPMVATVAVPVETWRTIPTYTATAYPQYFAPAYRTQVYQYYGLTPRERRVMDRVDRRNDRRNP